MVWLLMIPVIPGVFGNFLLPIMIGAKDVAFPRLNLASFHVYVVGATVTLTSLIIVTVHTLRVKGMGWMQMPMFVWNIYATSIIQVLATPVLGLSLLLVGIDHVWQIGLFDPRPRARDDRHRLHRLSDLGPPHVRRRHVGLRRRRLRHPVDVRRDLLGGEGLHLDRDAVRRPDHRDDADAYLFGFMFLFVGGMSGVAVATSSHDVHWHDTYFAVAHFHFIMVGGTLTGFLAALHYWFPKFTGRMYSEKWGLVSSMMVVLGFFFTFTPQFLLGNAGMPRRYYTYPDRYQWLHVMSTAGATILALGLVLTVIYLAVACDRGKRATANPWDRAASSGGPRRRRRSTTSSRRRTGGTAPTTTTARGFESLEYASHFAEGISPGAHYASAELPGNGARMFFTLYYVMTGLHALHVLAGLAVMVWLRGQIRRGRLTAARPLPLELGGLYWHLVDIVWIFLWPLLYLAS